MSTNNLVHQINAKTVKQNMTKKTNLIFLTIFFIPKLIKEKESSHRKINKQINKLESN